MPTFTVIAEVEGQLKKYNTPAQTAGKAYWKVRKYLDSKYPKYFILDIVETA